MTSFEKLYETFDTRVKEYIQANGPQTILQIKQIAKNYAIESREGRYDITARKRYYRLYMSYHFRNNMPAGQFPEGWGTAETNIYDPDNEFPNDPHVRKLTRNEEKRSMLRIREFEEYMRQREEEGRIRQRQEEEDMRQMFEEEH
jgi:hypothetical protein